MENNTILSDNMLQKSSQEKINCSKKKDIKNARFNLNFPVSRKNGKKSVFSGKDSRPFFSAENNFFQGPFFQEMLILERKRSERSQKQFLLMLIDIQKLVITERINGKVKKFMQVLNYVSRDTDIKGWYEENRIIGIIYTGITYMSIESIIEKVKSKINNTFDSEQAAAIDISYFLFPEKNNKMEHAVLNNNRILYSNTSIRNSARRGLVVSKRYMDIIGSAFGILLFSPLFIGISILVKLSSKGPVFFRQRRIGYGGKEFTFLKFRSMSVNNDNSAHKEFTKNFINGKNHNSKDGIFKIKEDPRITKIGRFIRKTSLDELPQFFNVLKGDMSLVGPRPALHYEVEVYNSWHKRRVFEVKPGITGIWQVKGRSKTTFDEMVRMDIQYINKCSIFQDLILILRTPFAVLMTKGAY